MDSSPHKVTSGECFRSSSTVGWYLVCRCTSLMYVWICRSYGVLLWEIATFGQFPHSDKTLDVLTELAGNGQLQLVPLVELAVFDYTTRLYT